MSERASTAPDGASVNCAQSSDLVCDDPDMTAGRVLRARSVLGGLVLIVGVGLAIGLLYFSTIDAPSTIWVDRLLVRTWTSGAVAVLLTIVGLGLTRISREQFAVATAVTAAIAVGMAAVVFFAGKWNRHASPDWSGMTSGNGLLQTNVLVTGTEAPRWIIRVEETGRGPLGRIDTVGCTSPWLPLTGLGWHGDILRIDVKGGHVDVRLDDRAGEIAIVERPDVAASPNLLVDC
jgi:hypothetical protein